MIDAPFLKGLRVAAKSAIASGYLTSRAGMLGLNRCIASDCGPEGLGYHAFCPGLVRKDMVQRVIDDAAAVKGFEMGPLSSFIRRSNGRLCPPSWGGCRARKDGYLLCQQDG